MSVRLAPFGVFPALLVTRLSRRIRRSRSLIANDLQALLPRRITRLLLVLVPTSRLAPTSDFRVPPLRLSHFSRLTIVSGRQLSPVSHSLHLSYFLILTSYFFTAYVSGSFTFEVIGGSLRAPSSRRRSKSSEIFA